jgi:hypothetical protein
VKKKHILLAALFVCFAVADSLVMHISLARGASELNPLVNHLLRMNEMGFWYFKAGFVASAVAVFLLLSRKYPVQVGRILIIITGLTAVDCAWDLSQLLYFLKG